MNKVLECYKKNSNGQMTDNLSAIVHSSLFHTEFAMVNGFEWLSTIGLGDYGNQENMVKLLIDQVVFESASPDLSGLLESTHICLQTLRGLASEHEWIKWIAEGGEIPNIASLYLALRWIHDNFIKMRYGTPVPLSETFDIPFFALIGRKKKLRKQSPGRIRSFDFVGKLSVEEWEEWLSRVKILVMGVKLGGLGCGPTHAQHRFARDPDGVCGHIYSA
jgi:hypothetical protein